MLANLPTDCLDSLPGFLGDVGSGRLGTLCQAGRACLIRAASRALAALGPAESGLLPFLDFDSSWSEEATAAAAAQNPGRILYWCGILLESRLAREQLGSPSRLGVDEWAETRLALGNVALGEALLRSAGRWSQGNMNGRKVQSLLNAVSSSPAVAAGRANFDINAVVDSYGLSPLHYAATRRKAGFIILCLLKAGADLTLSDIRGRDPIMMALASNQTENAKLLRRYASIASIEAATRAKEQQQQEQVQVQVQQQGGRRPCRQQQQQQQVQQLQRVQRVG